MNQRAFCERHNHSMIGSKTTIMTNSNYRFRRPLIGAVLTIALLALPLSPAAAGTLGQDIAALMHTRDLHGSMIGITVRDVRTNKVIFLENSDTRLVPASNRKLFVAALALHTLGDKYQTHTTLLADTSVAGDTLKGNVYLRGGGDALLSAADIANFGKTLIDSGVKHITGDIVGDGSIFSDGPYPDGWSVDYLADDYAAQISGLEVEQGIEQVTVNPGKAKGDKAIIKLEPASGYLPVNNSAVTVNAGEPSTLKITRPWNQNVLIVSGNVPLDYKQGKPVGITVDNPALYATTLLTEYLLSNGVTIDGATRIGTTPASAVTVADHASVPLSQYLPLMLKPSNNLMAECLIRLVGKEKGTAGTFDAGYDVEQAFLRDDVKLSEGSYSFADGSGVARLDLVTPNAIVKLLNYEAMQPNFKLFYDALPIGGVDGTLRHRMKGTPAEGNVHAKTGTVRFCHTLSGYVSDQDANILSFSIMNNNYRVDSTAINVFQDAVVARLAQEHSIGIVALPTAKPAPKPIVQPAKATVAAPAPAPVRPKPAAAAATPQPAPTKAAPPSPKPVALPAVKPEPAAPKPVAPPAPVVAPASGETPSVVTPTEAQPAKAITPGEVAPPPVAPGQPVAPEVPAAKPSQTSEPETTHPSTVKAVPTSHVAHSAETIAPAPKAPPKKHVSPAPMAPPTLAKPPSVLCKPSPEAPSKPVETDPKAQTPPASTTSPAEPSPSPVAVPAGPDDK